MLSCALILFLLSIISLSFKLLLKQMYSVKNILFVCTLMAMLTTALPAVGQKVISLYPDSIPNAISIGNEEYTDAKSHQVMNVSHPTLTIYLPAKNNSTGAAVIICPGGGYGSLVIDREGNDVAKRLIKRGIAAFVLKYRLPSSKTMKNRTIGPLQDAQQAIKYVREHARENNIHAGSIGIMGFSAGGHLASAAGVTTEPLIPNINGTKLQPDFMVLVYPVISMDTLIGHKGSTFNLLGPSPTKDQVEFNSTDKRVSRQTPPAFITVAGDDDLLENSLLFYNALRLHKISAELHIYSKGGHGYLTYPPFSVWIEQCINWIDTTLSSYGQ
jgi:acetyl esterase/lipase